MMESMEVRSGWNESLTLKGAYAGLTIPPSAYLAFFGSAANWQVTTDYKAANVSKAEGFIGTVYISLEELTPAVKCRTPLWL